MEEELLENSPEELRDIGKVVSPLPPDLASVTTNSQYITYPKSPDETDREEEDKLKKLRRRRGV